MPNENITILNGQAGVQVGSAIWELLSAEHGIQPDGRLAEDSNITEVEMLGDDGSRAGENFFYESSFGLHVPRAIFNDLEPGVIDQIRTGHYRDLFHPDNLISGKEDAANIFARGYWSIGCTKIASFSESLRTQMEVADRVSAIVSVHSCGGGTGSGYNALQFDTIYDLYPKVTKCECTISPSGIYSTNTVEPYNALLGTHYTMQPVDLTFIWDNDSLYRLCSKYVNITKPTYNNINRLVSQIFSSITACSRFGGPLSGHLIDYQTNLVPYPRIHFPVNSYSPILNRPKAIHEAMTIVTLTKSVFRNDSQFCCIDVENGLFVSACLLYRGDVSPSQVYNCVAGLKSDSKISFVDWCPTGVKFTLCCMPPTNIPASGVAPVEKNVMLMSNSSAVAEAFETLLRKFNHLYSKRAFVHWFVGEGMEEGEFGDAIDNIKTLILDYQECFSSQSGVVAKEIDVPIDDAPPAATVAESPEEKSPVKEEEEEEENNTVTEDSEPAI